MLKIKELNSKLKSTKSLLKMKKMQENKKSLEEDSSFFESSNLLSPVQESDFLIGKSEPKRQRYQTTRFKDNFEDIKLFESNKAKHKTSQRNEHQRDLVKIWKQVKLVNESIIHLYNAFWNVSKGKENDLSNLLNFEKVEYSNIEEEIEAFLSEANEEYEVSVTSIIDALNKIRENIKKILNQSTDKYLDHWSKECIVQ